MMCRMTDDGCNRITLYTVSAEVREPTNHTKDRKSSISSLFWHAPDRVLVTEYVGGAGAISELTMASNSVRTVWRGAEAFHAFGNFPDFALAMDGKIVAVVRSTFSAEPCVWSWTV